MKTIAHVLKIKGYNIWSITPDASVYEAIKLMADKGIGALLVREAGNLVGIISERDYARKVILQGKSSKETKIKEIMTRDVICADPRQTVEECLELMTEKHIRHLPVMVNGSLLGVVSIGDLVKTIISHQKVLIQQLENHILQVSSLT